MSAKPGGRSRRADRLEQASSATELGPPPALALAAVLAPFEIRSAFGHVVGGVTARPAGAVRHATGREPGYEWLVAVTHGFRRGSGPQYRELAVALRAAITSGDLPVGARLPPQRELARLLSVGRTTVVSACDLLRADSLLTMRQGAGTWVAGRPVPGRRAGHP